MAWKVSAVAPMAFDHHDYGYGFNVVNERGRPLANFIYGDEANTNEAASAMQTVLAKAIFMKAAP
jgi:hypothetical protein